MSTTSRLARLARLAPLAVVALLAACMETTAPLPTAQVQPSDPAIRILPADTVPLPLADGADCAGDDRLTPQERRTIGLPSVCKIVDDPAALGEAGISTALRACVCGAR